MKSNPQNQMTYPFCNKRCFPIFSLEKYGSPYIRAFAVSHKLMDEATTFFVSLVFGIKVHINKRHIRNHLYVRGVYIVYCYGRK
jgi:hypothetical protein